MWGSVLFATRPRVPKTIEAVRVCQVFIYISMGWVGGGVMFSSTITHRWWMVNHPSADNFSNEVDGDCSWNPEGSLCPCSSCELTGEKTSVAFIMHHYIRKPESIWVSSCPGTSGCCRIYTQLAVFPKKTFLGNPSWSKTAGRDSCVVWLGNDSKVSDWLLYHLAKQTNQKKPKLSTLNWCKKKKKTWLLFSWILVWSQENFMRSWAETEQRAKECQLLGIQKVQQSHRAAVKRHRQCIRVCERSEM